MLEHSEPKSEFFWVRCTARNMHLKDWTMSLFQQEFNDLLVCSRKVTEGLATGLSRFPSEDTTDRDDCPKLGEFVKVMRGIATGANEFFFLTSAQTTRLGISDEFLKVAIGRTRDVKGDEITNDCVRQLDEIGRPTVLLALDGRPTQQFSEQVAQYLQFGEQQGFHNGILVNTRFPWYKMESREVPPFLFAYLGRRSARFIRNTAGVLPLTGFLCVCPMVRDHNYLQQLWSVLNHPETVANLSLVGKSYGDGAIKVEPRALERLPLPVSVLAESGLRELRDANQLRLL